MMKTHDISDALLNDQFLAWSSGQRPTLESILTAGKTLPCADLLLDLIYNEILLREERGEKPTCDEYCERYPQLAGDIRLHFEVHAAIQSDDQFRTTEFPEIETPEAPSPETVPDFHFPQVPGFELLGILGEGGMGVVFKARQTSLNRIVALKMLRPGRVPTQREISRIRTEAEAIARLKNEHIVQIYEFGTFKDWPYLVLEIVDKGTLAQKIQQSPFTPRDAAKLIAQLARAIDYAHSQGILHRDLKPANILFDQAGKPRITDFGLAKILEEASQQQDITRAGEPLGTPRYMSPEQASGRAKDVSASSDIYGLGLLLYECLTGQVPFVAPTAVETMNRIRTEDAASPRLYQQSIPRDLDTICLHCLKKTPMERYASAGELADDLDNYLEGRPIKARATPMPVIAWKWVRRHPRVTVAIALLWAAIIGVGVYVDHTRRVEEQRVANLRSQVVQLMNDGHNALAQNDERVAKDRFLAAWTIVENEKQLDEFRTTINGWLNHTRQISESAKWNQRSNNPTYMDLKEECIIRLATLNTKDAEQVREFQAVLASAKSLIPEGEAAWLPELEHLRIIEALCDLVNNQPEKSLGALQQQQLATRAGVLAQNELSRICGKPIAGNIQSSGEPGWDKLYVSMIHWLRGERVLSLDGFENCSIENPDLMIARQLQAVNLMKLDRLPEANIALTACIAQRPNSSWNYWLRGTTQRRMMHNDQAEADLRKCLELNPGSSVRKDITMKLGIENAEVNP